LSTLIEQFTDKRSDIEIFKMQKSTYSSSSAFSRSLSAWDLPSAAILMPGRGAGFFEVALVAAGLLEEAALG
jgi:hypothetical protein